MKQSRFRPVQHLKMTVWTSVLWKINIQLAKKLPEIVVKWASVIVIHLDSECNSFSKNVTNFRFDQLTNFKIKLRICYQLFSEVEFLILYSCVFTRHFSNSHELKNCPVKKCIFKRTWETNPNSKIISPHYCWLTQFSEFYNIQWMSS